MTCSSAGYANEVGEAFRALVPVSAVWASYAVATAYVSADALDKGRKAAAVSLGQSGSFWSAHTDQLVVSAGSR